MGTLRRWVFRVFRVEELLAAKDQEIAHLREKAATLQQEAATVQKERRVNGAAVVNLVDLLVEQNETMQVCLSDS